MISQDRDIPFDISQGFVIFYENTIKGYLLLDRELRKLLRYLMNGGAIENPVQMSMPT
jgi:hypothetical protein